MNTVMLRKKVVTARKLFAYLATFLSLTLLLSPLPVHADQSHDRLILAEDLGQGGMGNGDMALINDRLVLATQGVLKSIDLNSGDITILPHGLEDVVLVGTGRQTMLFEQRKGLLYPFTIKEEILSLSEPIPLPGWQDFVERIAQEYNFKYILSGDALYVMYLDAYSSISDAQVLSRFPLSGGEPSDMQGGPFLAAANYIGNQLLVVLPPPSEKSAPLIAIYDPLSGDADIIRSAYGTKEKPVSSEVWGMCYDPVSNTLYLALGQSYYRYDALGEGRGFAAVPAAQHAHTAVTAISPDQIAIRQYQGILLRGTDGKGLKENETLTILGGMYYNNLRDAAARLPQYNIKSAPETNELAQTILTGGDSFDILSVALADIDFESLMKKGYALPLEDIEGLENFFQALPSGLRKSLSMDGHIYALPTVADGETLMVDTDWFAGEGISPPATFHELVNFLADWDDHFAAQYTDRQPLAYFNGRETLIPLARQLYYNSFADSNERFSWANATFKSMLEDVDALFPPREARYDEGDVRAPIIFPRDTLSDLTAFKGQQRDGGHLFYPMLLSAAEGREAVYSLSCEVLLINPRSAHSAAAKAFLRDYLREALPDQYRYLLTPGQVEPLENPNFEQGFANAQNILGEYQKKAKAASGAEKTELENMVRLQEQDLARYQETKQWIISQEEITAYQALSANNRVRSSIDSLLHGFMYELEERYVAGQINMEQFIEEAEGKTRLMLMENQ